MKQYLFVILIFSFGCKDTKTEKEYYSNGNPKVIIEYKDGYQDGETRTYYENGQLKYVGTYERGNRTGKHISYYPSGVVKYEYDYIIKNGSENAISKKEFDKDGVISFETTFVSKNVLIEDDKKGEYYFKDTVLLRLKLLNPKYENCMVILGVFDENLNVLELPKEKPTPFMGKNSEVRFWIIADKVGDNKITGIVRDFTIKALNDTLGYTVAEDSYFEYKFFVKRKSDI